MSSLNIDQAAQFFDVSRWTIREWRRRGYLPDKARWSEEELKAVKIPPKKRAPKPPKNPAVPEPGPTGATAADLDRGS